MDEDVRITSAFAMEDYWCKGKIQVSYLTATLDFETWIPHNYPLTLPNTDNISIVFKNADLIGFDHINIDGSVCFHPEKDSEFERKFLAEIKGLKDWIKKFYILNSESERYDYLIHPVNPNHRVQLFFSDVDRAFQKHEYGGFFYSPFDKSIAHTRFKQNQRLDSYFRIGFGENQEDQWSKSFHAILSEKYLRKGIWYFIEDEPLIPSERKRKPVKSWKDIQRYFSQEFIQYLYDGLKRNFNKNFFTDDLLFLTIGYRIPSDEGYEVHWDLVLISKDSIPIETERVPKDEQVRGKKYRGAAKEIEINWGLTTNLSYNRFFGRGHFCDNLINSSVFLIGCGALGSAVAETLVRGGLKKLFIEDFDNVASGNICRAKFNLSDVGKQKVTVLAEKLNQISPHVEIVPVDVKLNLFKNSTIESDLEKSVDLIIDCSTDPEVTFILDSLEKRPKVFSLALTNKAKSLISITGQDLTVNAHNLFSHFENEPPSYYEGAGCGYATFEASFNDIGALVHPVLKRINRQLQENTYSQTLVAKDLSGTKGIELITYTQLFQPDLKSYLYIADSVLTEIEKAVKDHYPKEFGGVFIGNSTSSKSLLIEDILIPDAYENGRTVFVRHPGSLNDRLKLIYQESDGRIDYVGEWHSHPDAVAVPSSTDKKAMDTISKNKDINTTNPIMAIMEVRKDQTSIGFYIYKEGKLFKYE